MKKIICTALLVMGTQSYAVSPWLENLDRDDKQQQMDLRWKASGGQVDIKFMHQKLQAMNIQLFPQPEFPEKNWDRSHLVFSISKNSELQLQMPYGNVEKVTDGYLSVDADFSLSSADMNLKVNAFKLVPMAITRNESDIVNFQLIDQNGRHMFNIYSVHIEYDKDRGLLKMSNMDLFATQELEDTLKIPGLKGQVVGQLHTYNHLNIPKEAQRELTGLSCSNRPLWDADVDVQLTNMSSVQWVGNVDSNNIIVAPSAELKNVGPADVPWYSKYSGSFPPFDNDQHPFLNWSMYREVDGRFEQMGVSGIKHAFLTINSNCTLNCNDNHILWPGCEDVYGVGTNDSSSVLGPRDELNAFEGTWDNCGTFFDPEPCTGSQQNSSSGTGQNRLVVNTNELTDNNNDAVYMQSWYLIRDDINIFNSMGYRTLNPSQNGGNWNMSPSNDFTNGPALDKYVPRNTIGSMQASQTIATSEGQFAVAVKVVDLGGGLYRYNYAIENYDFDPRFVNFNIPLANSAMVADTVFADPDTNDANNWQFSHSNGILSVIGNTQNEQDWGELFSFSFTSDSPPYLRIMTIGASESVDNVVVTAPTLVPELIFKNGME